MELEEKIKTLERRIAELEERVFPESADRRDAVAALLAGDERPLRIYHQRMKGEKP
jgi:hypothetical protein